MTSEQIVSMSNELNSIILGLVPNFIKSSCNDLYLEPSGKIYTVLEAASIILARCQSYWTMRTTTNEIEDVLLKTIGELERYIAADLPE